MSVIVTDSGFSPDDLAGQVDFIGPDDLANLDQPGGTRVQGRLHALSDQADRIDVCDAPPPPGAAVIGLSLDLPGDTDADTLHPHLNRLVTIRVQFASFSDGRGFTLARRLRRMGFAGRLRAAGHLIADQYAMARRSGFDEVELSDELAHRQPEAQWLFRADWRAHDHQSRLQGSLAAFAPASQDAPFRASQ